MNVLQTPTFKKQVKKLHKNQKIDLKKAIKKITQDPYIGKMKKGDLTGTQVYKFKMIGQLMLLAYEFDEDDKNLVLLALGSHENFYQNLKR